MVQEPLLKRSLIVPKSALAEVGSRGLLRTGTVPGQNAPAVTLLSDYLDGLSRTLDGLPLGALPAARNATIELLAAALQAVPSGAPETPALVLCAAEAYIDRHLGDATLCPEQVAAGVSRHLVGATRGRVRSQRRPSRVSVPHAPSGCGLRPVSRRSSSSLIAAVTGSRRCLRLLTDVGRAEATATRSFVRRIRSAGCSRRGGGCR